MVFFHDPSHCQALGKYLKRNMSSASGRKLPQSTYDAVVKLCQDKANTVFIVSGLNDKGLMQVSFFISWLNGDVNGDVNGDAFPAP